MLSPWPRRLIYSVVALGVVGAFVYVFQPRPLAVEFGRTSVAPMMITIDEEGRSQVKNIYVVSAPIAGRKLRITKKVGEKVVAGETILASIEPSRPAFLDIRSAAEAKSRTKAAQAALTLAAAELQRNLAELKFARADFTRAAVLVKRGTISKRELERAELGVKTKDAAVATARAGLRVKQFDLETANAALIDPGMNGGLTGKACCINVRAPINGQILRVIRESAAVVGMGTPLVEVGDASSLEIVVDLLSSDAVRVQAGDEVMIDAWGGGKTLRGQVRRVEPTGFTKISALGIEEQRVNILIDLTGSPENHARLGHGYRVETRIIVWRNRETLQIPMSALFRKGEDWAAFAVIDGTARLRPLKIGKINSEQAQIVEGLSRDETVVQHPSDLLTDGRAVVQRSE
ncbi:MAG: HlyD family efflux transporter periplasmic adaptor subunit [Rhodospirillaceae bacterium]|jgi:HlyD family secretion protein|nr:HlyD family efflux transporter periplasmic adaptor subunit [Rhodospirillaceae bacterium]MBT4491501.1 HlyD family efflux transporter periplasmic adaptor subunit [Rhodospirillaceae bacterium]MBT5193675.1 HlyD family efflux transporter periplasmic adaptor subunit [Rhodospirillaceae bacterium]MBT5897889.1 HlyD family efflux transporter periplasmic adaptor subunit [Rhodospirillaceae bacterium]MBT6428990.1 HlyD family efflux transporter periplasmic adaptor subunit [Rhodospirillaceae bacterium]